ncbi:hypothetical protein [Geminocystis sp. GBBB08]|uniref:hypothetical protein n=1 Tax=Geminocystis sp. GBBB08 TaxID=2604140 RepID=UPI0027E37500|nr:hypothetical protein [Geminocystis sp. GBBB08]MBL1208276.1 hypothetical protein [Geminocystis sp. GBBB08]
MTIVMISGSRSVTELPSSAVNSLNKIMELGFDIVVGDCSGIDTLVQKYLQSQHYQNVTVYHINNKPRNNVGFKTIKIQGRSYSAKDIAMAEIADYGLAIWNNKSKGTKANIDRIKRTKVITV